MKHTHRGTCQACGHVQAVSYGGSQGQAIAKHGYTVDWGYFHGVCRGSDAMPLEMDRTMTDAIITILRDQEAPRCDKRAADLADGVIEPKFHREVNASHYPRRGGYTAKFNRIDIECKRSEISEYQADQQIRTAIHMAERDARMARAHADGLAKLIIARHGQPLYPVDHDARKKALTVGAKVRIGGAKGDVYEVTELRDQVCRGCGPYMNGKLMLHAILVRPDGRRIGIPARSIRASAIISEGGADAALS